MSTPSVPIRRGIPKTITLDPDAVDILTQLAPSQKRYGPLVSELLRAEVSRREERHRVRQELAAQLLGVQ